MIKRGGNGGNASLAAFLKPSPRHYGVAGSGEKGVGVSSDIGTSLVSDADDSTQ